MRAVKLRQIRERMAAGWTDMQIAEEYAVSLITIQGIRKQGLELADGRKQRNPRAPREPREKRPPTSRFRLPPPPRPTGAVTNLTEAAQVTRDSLLGSVETLAARVLQLDMLLEALFVLDDDGLLNLAQVKPQLIYVINTARAITVDKQAVVLSQLRALESEAAESLEMAFTIVEELPDGTRRVVGQPPELEHLGVIGFRVPDPNRLPPSKVARG